MITIEAGADGVDEHWIEELKQMHREEANMLRRGRSKGAGKNYLLSLTQIEEELGEKSEALADPAGSVEDRYIAEEERKLVRRQIADTYNSLTQDQRKLLTDIRFRQRTMTEAASDRGVSRQAISKQIIRIEHKFKENVLQEVA